MRSWLLFGVAVCLVIAVLTFVGRPPPLPERPLDLDGAPTGGAPPAGAAALPFDAAEAAGASFTPPAVSAPPTASESMPAQPSLPVVARIAGRAVREPAEALVEALSLDDPALRGAAVRAVLEQWSPEYPDAAAAHVDALSTYEQRLAAADAFSRAYAARDPFAALEWLRLRTPPIVEPARNLLAAIEGMPPARAIEIVRETAGSEDARAVAAVRLVAITFEIDPELMHGLADEALALPRSEPAEQILAFLVGAWADRSAVAALEWLVRQQDALEPSAFMQAAYRVGARTPDTGAAYADRVPPALRNAWIGAVATGHANVDPFAAGKWIGRFENDAAYPNAAAAVAEPLALFDGPAAAALLERVDPALPIYVNAAAGVGAGWARQDAEAAAAWAEGLTTRAARLGAMAAVAREWFLDDRDRALALTMRMPRSAERDRVLPLFVSADPLNYRRNSSIQSAFSNQEAYQRAAREAEEAYREQQQRQRVERERALGLR